MVRLWAYGAQSTHLYWGHRLFTSPFGFQGGQPDPPRVDGGGHVGLDGLDDLFVSAAAGTNIHGTSYKRKLVHSTLVLPF